MAHLDHRRQTTLITGASSGIGEQFARHLAARGSAIVLVARRADRLEALAAELREAHGTPVTTVVLDLSEPAAGAALVAEMTRRGVAVTAVVNNAGSGSWGRFHDQDPEQLRRMIALDVGAVADISRAFIQQLRAAGTGYLLNVASVAAYQPIPNQAAYSATKAFVLSLTEALWAESRGTGLRVMAFSPGVTRTEFFDVVGTTAATGGWRYQTAQQVVATALRALERSDPPPSVVSGWRNHALTVPSRLLTRRRAVTVTAAATLSQPPEVA